MASKPLQVCAHCAKACKNVKLHVLNSTPCRQALHALAPPPHPPRPTPEALAEAMARCSITPEPAPPAPEPAPPTPFVLSEEIKEALAQRPLALKTPPCWKPDDYAVLYDEFQSLTKAALTKGASPLSYEGERDLTHRFWEFEMPTRGFTQGRFGRRTEAEWEWERRVNKAIEDWNAWKPEPHLIFMMSYNDHKHEEVLKHLQAVASPFALQLAEVVRQRKVEVDKLNKSRRNPIRTTYINIHLTPDERYYYLSWDIRRENMIYSHYPTEFKLDLTSRQLVQMKSRETLGRLRADKRKTERFKEQSRLIEKERKELERQEEREWRKTPAYKAFEEFCRVPYELRGAGEHRLKLAATEEARRPLTAKYAPLYEALDRRIEALYDE